MAVITITDTGVISYVSTRNLAERFGFGPLSWLYPLCLDAVAAVGMDLWMSGSRAQRPAKWLALSAVALSLAANVADWMLSTGIGAAVLGAVPPLMLAALLLTMHRHVSTTDSTGQDHQPAPVSAPAPAPPVPADTPVPPVPVPRSRARQPGTETTSGGVSDGDLVVQIRDHERVHGPLARRAAMNRFGIGTGRATRLLELARNGHTPDPPTTGDHT